MPGDTLTHTSFRNMSIQMYICVCVTQPRTCVILNEYCVPKSLRYN